MKYLCFVSLLVLICVTSASAKDISTEDRIKALETAHFAVDPVKKNLMKTLQGALAKSGPEKAIDECKTEAPKLTDAAIEVGRTSLKLRNPKNKPRNWMMPHLKRYEHWKPGQAIESEILVPLGKNHYGYLEPIFVQSMCLSCHGKSLSPGVKKELKQFYPTDEATGFAPGALRGFFWAEVKY